MSGSEPTFFELNAARAANAAVRALEPPPGITPQNSIFCILAGGGADANGKGLQNWRISQAPWQRYSEHVLVAGTRGDPEYNHEEVRDLLSRSGRIPDFDFQGVDENMNTVVQARWLHQLIHPSSKYQHVYISAADYHVGRGALTFIATWQNLRGRTDITVSVVPTNGEIAGQNTTSTSDNLEDEIRRIAIYDRSGDVAGLDNLHMFL